MEHRLITYQAKHESAAENERLIRAVFEELRAVAPDGVRYAVLRLADDTFVHLVGTEPDGFSIPSLAAFQQFQTGIEERESQPAQARGATIIGNYRMVAE